jgi:hypothetical protein
MPFEIIRRHANAFYLLIFRVENKCMLYWYKKDEMPFLGREVYY